MKKILLSIAAVLIILLAAMPANADNSNGESVKDAAEYAEQELLLQEGIAGISYTEDPDRVIVYIESEEYRTIVPEKIKEFETEVRVSGRFKALGMPQQSIHIQPKLLPKSRTERWDPLVGGISLGNEKDYGCGTLGIVFEKGAEKYILSNTHVIAMDTDGGFNPVGTKVIQPGYLDGGGDVVGYLKKYTRIKWVGTNYVDAAIAICTVDAHINELLDSDNENTYSVNLENKYLPEVGDNVKKSGRTTGVTQNKVIDNHATVTVWYDNFGWAATFKDQIVVKNPFSEGGDSGSIVTESEYPNRFVGLLFAGSDYNSVINKAWRVWEELGLKQKAKSAHSVYQRLLDLFPNALPLLRLLPKL